MATLPNVGGDSGVWGTELNTWLVVGHNADGTHFVVAPKATAPQVVVLTDGATISPDASLGNHFRVTLGGNRTMANPANPTDGQRILFEIIQDGSGSRTLSYGTAYNFGTAGAPTLTTTQNKRDLLGFIYSGSATVWLFSGSALGF